MKTTITILALSLQLAGVHLESGALGKSTDSARRDWPQWRGENRDAVSTETGLIHDWPDSGPEILWRQEIGAGFSGVSVSDGKLYTMWDAGGKQYLFCLEAGSGQEIWRLELGVGFSNSWGNGPRSTPLVDGDFVFAVGTDGVLIATERKTGRLLWQHSLVHDFGAKLPTYGYSSSPMVAGERLFVEAGGEGQVYVALNKKDGKVLWTSRSDRVAYSSPVSTTIAGVEQLIFWSAGGLRSLSPADGSTLWKYDWETLCPVTGDPLNTGTPIFVAPDRVYISSGSGAAMVQLSMKAGSLHPQLVWESNKMRSDVNTSVLYGDHIYGFDGAIFKCLDAKTGELKWKARGFKRGSVIAADGQLIILSERGKLALAQATPAAFVKTSTAQILNGKCWTAPTLAQGRLYLRNHKELVCLNIKK